MIIGKNDIELQNKYGGDNKTNWHIKLGGINIRFKYIAFNFSFGDCLFDINIKMGLY